MGGPSSPTPVGLFIQALFRALVSSNDSDSRFISSMLDAFQCMGDPESFQDEENPGFALRLCPGDSQQFGQLSESLTRIGPQNRPRN